MKTYLALFLLLIALNGCTPAPATVTTGATPATVVSSSTPVEAPRWIVYERALSDIFLGSPGRISPDVTKDHGLCEWEIWGQKANEVYVWALCQGNNAVGTATSAPAVIRLGNDGIIQEIEMPEEDFGNIKELFPKGVLNKIEKQEFPAGAAWDRIQRRRNDPSILPWIVEQGVALP